jgi:hypothetical protein
MLYADDLMLITSYQHLNSLLISLIEISTRFNLKMNAKMSGVFAVKRHDKLTNAHNLHGIQVVTEYCYVEITVNHSDSIAPHLNKVRQRSSYLRLHLRYHACHFSFENQYLLWSVYVRPYFMYVAPLLGT